MKITSYERQAYEWAINSKEGLTKAARSSRALARLIQRELFSKPALAGIQADPETLEEIKRLVNPNRPGGVSHFELERAQILLADLEPKPARDDGDFYSGIITALAVVHSYGEDTIHQEIVETLGAASLGELLTHAEAEEEIAFAGLERLYEEWKKKEGGAE